MKKGLLFVIILWVQTCAAEQTKILWIGASMTYFNNLPLMLQNLALSNGDTVVYDSNLFCGVI